MPHQLSAPRSGDGSGDLERRVEAADDLVRQTVVSLCKDCPSGALGPAAHGALKGLRPGVRGALGALEEIEERRPLTDEETARRRAFAMLL
jgi:hypothetical protein